MKVNALAFDLLKAFDTKASLPKETRQAPPAPAGSEPIRTPQKPIVNGVGIGLEFSVDETTGVNVIRVYDIETGEVIRQMPPEEALAFLRQYEARSGLFFSRRL
jgi:flagellar protein FlaG